MWLSKLVLNLRSQAARRDLANPYEMHRTLSWTVAEALQARGERLLWRVEPYRLAPPTVLVQTLTKPDWSRVFARFPDYGQLDPTSPKFFDPQFRVGEVLRFRLRANPTVKRLGKRYALRSWEEKMDWLARKLEESGAELVQAVVSNEMQIQARKPGQGAGALVTLYAVLFDGYLRVREPERLKLAVARGLGPAKGFGMGLLSLARPR